LIHQLQNRPEQVIKLCKNAMKNLILTANNGLKTKFDASQIRFSKTFADAKKAGVDLNNTNIFFKKDGFVWKVSVVSGRHSKKLGGHYFESFSLLPWLRLQK
jgi:DNA replicative helicase MCM subunit Mcm2 (Cdc46/Mcm family)